MGSEMCIRDRTGSVDYERLCEALTNKALIRGIKQASPLAQTSCLEGFHSVLNHFAPKMIAYSYAGMYCRYTKISSLQSNASCTGISVIIAWVTNYSSKYESSFTI